jgi:hypothetical protein
MALRRDLILEEAMDPSNIYNMNEPQPKTNMYIYDL